MKIVKVDVFECIMPKEDPEWAFALGSNPLSENLCLALTGDDGTVGYGLAASVPHMGASMASLRGILADFAPKLEGCDSFDIEAISRNIDASLTGNNQAKAAVNCALYDLSARSLGLPLYKLLGGKVRDEIPVLRIVAIKKPDEMAKNSQLLVDKGYRYLKIKVHGDVEEDVARVRAIRKQVGDDIHLTIDANQSYDVKDAIQAINKMVDYNIELAEQPVNIDDLEGLKLVTQSVPVTVEADESAGTLKEVMYLVNNRIVDAVSLKIPKLGGIRNTIAAARLCEAAQVRYRLGAHVGSRLIAAFAPHVSAALPGIDYACELGEFDRLLDDKFEGIEIENGSIRVPETPGAGVTLIGDIPMRPKGAVS